MSNIKFGAVEKNIYCEKRGDSLRIVVQVSPHPKKSITVSDDDAAYERGLEWARQKRDALRDVKEGKSPSAAPVVPKARPSAASEPGDISIRAILDNYRVRELGKLAGASADSSRLKRLDKWFGHLTLSQLDYDTLDQWMSDRQSGLLGSGRASNPGLTKHQRYYRKAAGKELPPVVIVPPSAQTIRHEITLMRRTLIAYFRANKLNQDYGTWLQSQYIMDIPLPQKPEPRDNRVEEDALALLVKELDDPMHIAFVQFAVMTTLRRSEVCSLRWKDVNLKTNVITLRAPGHRKKSKTHTREVPLLPPAIQILKKLGLKDEGPIFAISPSGITQAVRRAADRAGLQDVRLHDLRREGISRLVELLEASLEDVMVFSGHSDREVLQRHYLQQRANIVGARLARHPGAATMISAT